MLSSYTVTSDGLVFTVENEDRAIALYEEFEEHLQTLADEWGQVAILWCGCNRGLRKFARDFARMVALNSLKGTLIDNKNFNGGIMNNTIAGLITKDWLRVADEICNESRPSFLVSMLEHRNVLVNQAACELMNCDASELLSRNLAPLWVPPGQVKPVSYKLQLPPHLDELHRLLQQQTSLTNHKFENWKSAGDDADWVRWSDDIRYVELDEHPYRLMVVNGFDVLA